jgi:DNA mismatch repair protein MutL
MKIRILPPQLCQQIAAGEVIERPASVVKELLENALDAGAHQIAVEVEHAGRQLIRVSDDGAGMVAEDAPLAFERFATSKIQEAGDIAAMRTFGFRGEALPSIAAVSRVQLVTRPRGMALGTCVRIEGGRRLGISEIGSRVGTTVEVRDLFFNTPVRRTFLRSLRVELSHILGVFTTYAVAFPEFAWTLSCDGKALFTLAAMPYHDRLQALYGQEATAHMAMFDREGLSGRIWGSVGRDPMLGRRSYRLFVNRRPVRSATLYRAVHAVLGGVGTLLLFLEMAPELIDVNVHPAKREVRFRDEEGVYDLVLSALSRDRRDDTRFAESVAEREAPYAPSTSAEAAPAFQAIGQVDQTFLLATAHGHLYMIDQHAAHERVLYDRLLSAIDSGVPPQRLLIAPQVLMLAGRELEILESHRPEMEACGWNFDQFGPGAVAVRGIPDFITAHQTESVCRRLIQRLRDNIVARRLETLPQMLACLAAIKAGTAIPVAEQERLLRDWTKSNQAHACAHNRPVYWRIGLDEIRRRVGRTSGGCGEESEQP